MTESVVEIVGLSKRFGAGVLAVDDLSFAVERGQVCGLLGPNGAGKTTCLRMLLGLIQPTGGETYLFGDASARRRRAAPRRRADRDRGVRAAPLGHAEPGAVVAGGRRVARRRRLRARSSRSPISATRSTARCKTYSQGMRQRLGLARVLLGRPEVLVLDEPTNGLDPGEMREVRQLVHRVADAGATVLFSSHVLAEVEQICTHAVVMDKGHLVAAGSVEDLIGSAGVVYLEVDDVAAAQRVLRRCPRCSGSSASRPASR